MKVQRIWSLVLAIILTIVALTAPVKPGDLVYRIGVLIGRFIIPAFFYYWAFKKKKS
ncbi:hypothetical protein ACVRXF_00725 [Streptococcus orisasini]